MKTALLLVADGTEEMEAVIIADILVRGNMKLTIASVAGRQVTCSRGVRLVADVDFNEIKHQSFDAVILPGGLPGAQHLSDDKGLIAFLREHIRQDRFLGAICAAPALVLAKHGLLEGKQATCYPGFEDAIDNFIDQPVVSDGNILTSKGPGTAIPFALAILDRILGQAVSKEISEQLIYS